MPIPGWYADPAGTPDRFRYWDGQKWVAGTTADPSDAPPPGNGQRNGRRSRTPLVVAAVLALVLAVLAAIVIVTVLRQPTPVTPTPSSPPSDPGRTSSPIPPLPSAPPTGPNPAPSSGCPVGDPMTRQRSADDGRIHGGGLSFPRQPNYLIDAPSSQLRWAYDVRSQSRLVQASWSSSFAVGALLTTEGFETPRRSAALVLDCTAPSWIYPGFTGRKILTSDAVHVDGHKAWAMRAEVYVQDPHTTAPGDVVEVIVVDGESPESLGMFWASVPIGDPAALTQLDRVASNLRVD